MSTIDRSKTRIEPLEPGQRLSQPEFHARYEAMPPGTRAELIGGVVHMPSPLGRRHGVNAVHAVTWLGLYSFRTPGVEASENASTILDDQSEVQPDVLLRILPECRGQTSHARNLIEGAPELVVEVADSSRAIDLGVKLAEYERAGVLEYVVATLDPRDVHWHKRQGGRLVRVPPDPDGLYRSDAFPGLWLDPQALLAEDGLALVATLERGLASAEHAAFVARLVEARQTAH